MPKMLLFVAWRCVEWLRPLSNRWRIGAANRLGPHITGKRSKTMAVMTGLSGNEIYCLRLKGLRPGDLVIGNSVFSMGFIGSIGAGVNTFLGGEVSQVTSIIHEGRVEAFKRMISEASERGGAGITGVTNELRHFHGNTEFLSVASVLHRDAASESI